MSTNKNLCEIRGSHRLWGMLARVEHRVTPQLGGPDAPRPERSCFQSDFIRTRMIQ
jgi:hypothetical protein